MTSEISDKSSVFALWARFRILLLCLRGGESLWLTLVANWSRSWFGCRSVAMVGMTVATGGFSERTGSGDRFWSVPVEPLVVVVLVETGLVGKTVSSLLVISLGGTSSFFFSIPASVPVLVTELDREDFWEIASSTTSIHIRRIFSVRVPIVRDFRSAFKKFD